MTGIALQARELAVAFTNPKSGRLGASITALVTQSSSSVSIMMQSSGVPYAHAQDQGADIPAHDIVPVRARALLLSGYLQAAASELASAKGQSAMLAAKVHWPGAVLPAKHFMLKALEGVRGEFIAAAQTALAQSLAEGA
jgi:hypothetical protein